MGSHGKSFYIPADHFEGVCNGSLSPFQTFRSTEREREKKKRVGPSGFTVLIGC